MAHQTQTTGISSYERSRLESLAGKNLVTAGLLGFLLPPVGYLYVGKTGWALLNLVTLNYLFLGFILTPLHTRRTIQQARTRLDELERHTEPRGGDGIAA